MVPTKPDAFSGFIMVDYNATTHAFSAIGIAQTLTLADMSSHPLSNDFASFSLTATILNDGTATAGTMDVTGAYPGPATSSVFHSTSLTSFALHPGASTVMDFVFAQEGPSSVPGAGPGSQIGTILTVFASIPNFSSEFHYSFLNNTTVTADSFILAPLPGAGAAGAMGLAGLAGVGIIRRRRTLGAALA